MKPTSAAAKMKTPRIIVTWIVLGASLLWLTGCASTRRPNIRGPVPVMMAEVELPESQLLDIGIELFEPSTPDSKPAERNEALGSTPEIQRAESHFIPYHLKSTLQRTGNWGAVRVTPTETDSVDVSVKGKILESNGAAISLHISPWDSGGRKWYSKTYTMEAEKQAFTGNTRGELDAYQDTYNAIANDLLAYKNSLGSKELDRLRTISELKFAADLAPAQFGDHLETDKNGKVDIIRLPAEEDPNFQRLQNMREREYMLIDVINEHYEDYYIEMWEPYEDWREFSQAEAENLAEVKKKARNRKLIGAAAIAGAIAVEVLGGGKNTGTLRDVMVIGGIEAVRSGFGIGAAADMHKEALAELGESFGADIAPRTVDIEGETQELTGTAAEQYTQWREILKKIYIQETGFDPDAPLPDS